MTTARSLREAALEEVRRSPDALVAGRILCEEILSAPDRVVEGRRLAERLRARLSAKDVLGSTGQTSRGALPDLVDPAPRSLEDLAIVNCFFSVGCVDSLIRTPREGTRRLARALVRRCDRLLADTPYSPFEYLPLVAPVEYGVPLWDELVTSIVEGVNQGRDVTPTLLLRAETLRALPSEVRLSYVRRVLAECHEPDAALRFGALFAAIEDAPPLGADRPRALIAPPRPQPTLPARKAPGAQRALSGEKLGGSKHAPLLTGAAPPTPAPFAAEPVALHGGHPSGPRLLSTRALYLLTGLALLRDLAAMLGRVLGLRRATSLTLAGEALIVEETLLLFGRRVRRRARAYAHPAVTSIEREIPHPHLYLLLALAVGTLVLALLLPSLAADGPTVWREVLLVVCGALLAGIALDLLRFAPAFLRSGQCAISVDVRGGGRIRLAGVPEAELERFVAAARARGAPQPASKLIS
jgi:hypothetical protein